MKLVINITYGGFWVPEALYQQFKNDPLYHTEAGHCDGSVYVRSHPMFIDWIEKHPHNDYAIVEIPTDATDWAISEYDGKEHVIAVVNGKLVFIYG